MFKTYLISSFLFFMVRFAAPSIVWAKRVHKCVRIQLKLSLQIRSFIEFYFVKLGKIIVHG